MPRKTLLITVAILAAAVLAQPQQPAAPAWGKSSGSELKVAVTPEVGRGAASRIRPNAGETVL